MVKYTINSATKSNIESLCYFMQNHFATAEPLQLAVGTSSCNAFVSSKKWLSQNIPQGLSFIANDPLGNIIGLVQNSEYFREETDNDVDTSSELLNTLNFLEKHVNFISEKCDKEMELQVITVHNDWRRKGVAKELVKKTIVHARENGFQQIRSLCTSAYSAKLLLDCGFKSVCNFEYKDLKEKGKLSVVPADPHTHLNGVVIKL